MDLRGTALEDDAAISKIGVVGAGEMGGGIAQVCAAAGYEVRLQDISAERVEKGLKTIGNRLNRLVERQKLSGEDREAILARISTGTALEPFADCDLVVEAAFESEKVKSGIFAQLCPILPEKTIVCSNTSSISVTLLASRTDRPDKFMGMHFMNPVPVMKLVETIRALTTSDETVTAVNSVVATLGKKAVPSQDYPAFIVNRILLPMINEAVVALHEGVGTVADIDEAMKLGANMPMGPLELGDFIGLDVCLAIMRVLYEGTADFEVPALPDAGEICGGRLVWAQNGLRVL